MTKLNYALLFTAAVAFAQEPAATPAASSTPSRSIRISFVPPPLEGTISLGIYDENDQLVRVLHQEASFDDFTAGPDALVTKWDGKDDFGYELWPGTYHARGFLVAPMKVQEITAEATPAPEQQAVKVRLMANPLEKSERPTIQLMGGIDDEDVLLKTVDGLPLLTMTQAPGVKRVSVAPGENGGVTVHIETDATSRRFSIAGVNRMMAFDCGEFELR
ncbi:MAG: hypothetical protein DLM52_08285 [Chthoniobacterales bacterium]|nr:MAG: hypothetical protein DLM52_08285 [Chthoniobacterales bacterium]